MERAAATRIAHSTSGTTPRSRLLPAVRTLWLVVAALDIGLFVASVPERWQQLREPSSELRSAVLDFGMTVNGFAAYHVALEVVFALVFVAVAGVIFARKLNEPPALFFSLLLLMFGTASIPILGTMDALVISHPVVLPLVRLVTYLNWSAVFIFFCIFPDGRFVPNWTKAFAIFATLVSVPWDLFPDSLLSPWTWPPAIFIPFEIAIWGTCIYMQVQRYRRVSNQTQRQQTRWVIFGMAVSVVGIMVFFIPRVINPALLHPTDRTSLSYYLMSSTGIALSALFTPLAIGTSILRYRLWAIDLIISRALVYVPLTGILAGLYAASIALFQKVFIALTGDKSDGAIVISTLILASLFTPVKNGLQAAVDKQFKERENPTASLDEFEEQVEAIVQVFNAHSLARRLLEESTAAFGATGGAVYLSKHANKKPHRASEAIGDMHDLELVHRSEGWEGDAGMSMSLKDKGKLYGLIVLGPRTNGKQYTPEDREKLHEVVQAVSEAIGLAELTK